MRIREIEYGSSAYAETLDLRNRVMRIPLGLSIYDEDLSCEEGMYIACAFAQERMLGVGVLSLEPGHTMVKYLCVDTAVQKTGIGGALLDHLEEKARAAGAAEVSMDARVSAQPFYEKHGYVPEGEIYLMDCAPVEHIYMVKKL